MSVHPERSESEMEAGMEPPTEKLTPLTCQSRRKKGMMTNIFLTDSGERADKGQ